MGSESLAGLRQGRVVTCQVPILERPLTAREGTVSQRPTDPRVPCPLKCKLETEGHAPVCCGTVATTFPTNTHVTATLSGRKSPAEALCRPPLNSLLPDTEFPVSPPPLLLHHLILASQAGPSHQTLEVSWVPHAKRFGHLGPFQARPCSVFITHLSHVTPSQPPVPR